MSNKEKYKKEIRGLRKLLNDFEYTRTLSHGYHGFLAKMHKQLISNKNLTQKMLESVNTALKFYNNYNRADIKVQREKMLAKITKLKQMLHHCGYSDYYIELKMEFLDSLTKRAHSRGTLTPKQAKYANNLYKQFSKRILP
tara:strand:- start:27 stop:449 length:423 start_codon:yes stop_codon:yes gene_type:complete